MLCDGGSERHVGLTRLGLLDLIEVEEAVVLEAADDARRRSVEEAAGVREQPLTGGQVHLRPLEAASQAPDPLGDCIDQAGLAAA